MRRDTQILLAWILMVAGCAGGGISSSGLEASASGREETAVQEPEDERQSMPVPVRPAEPVVIRDLRITSDRTVDCTSVERMVEDIIRPGMTDRKKAEACWDFMRLRTFHKSPGKPSPEMHNPVTILNHHGQMQCGIVAEMQASLIRGAGLPADGGGAVGHRITEVFYEGAWHMYDADMHNYYVKPDGSVASIYEIANTPELRDGPETKSYPWFSGHDWLPGIMDLYTPTEKVPLDKARPADPEYVARHSRNPRWRFEYQLDLRPGTEIVWSWFPDPDIGYARVNYIPEDVPERAAKDEPWPDALRGGLPTAPLQSVPGFGANGRLTLDFGRGWRAFWFLAENVENLEVSGGLLRQVEPDKEGSFEVQLALPYYFADGWIEGSLPRKGLRIILTGAKEQGKQVWPRGGHEDGGRLRLYDEIGVTFSARIRFVLEAGSAVRLEPLKVVGVFHHNFTALPALLKGLNIVTVHCAEDAALADYPLEVTYVYDQRDDGDGIARRARSFAVVPGRKTFPVDAGDRHWPLMRSLSLRCLIARSDARPAASGPVPVSEWDDWGSYPFSKSAPGVNYHNDFERGDKDGWRADLVTSPTHRGSDFAIRDHILNEDGSSQLKIIRNIGVLNHNTRIRFAAYVQGAESVRFYTQDRTDRAFSDPDKRAYYEKVFTGLEQGHWNILECGVNELVCPRYPERPFPKAGRLAGFYVQAKPFDGTDSREVVFVIDDFVCWDGDVMREDPLSD